MRWIFLLVLMVNVVVYAVQWIESQAKRTAANKQHKVPPVSLDAQTLMMLSEIKLLSVADIKKEQQAAVDNSAASNSDKKETAQTASSLDSVEKKCALVGPVLEEERALELKNILGGKKIETKMHRNEMELAPRYWVYIPPLKSRKEAIKKVERLQAKNIDSFVIRRKDLSNGISLGLFRNKDSAYRMLDLRKSEGYQVELKVVERSRTEYWLLPSKEVDVKLQADMKGVLTRFDQNIQVRQIFCKSVASYDDLP